jgi:hypothetical protein
MRDILWLDGGDWKVQQEHLLIFYVPIYEIEEQKTTLLNWELEKRR